MPYLEYLPIGVLAYLLGSIPTGLIVGKLAGGIDVRYYGSGKIGAANILRTLGPGAFALVFIGDFLKGYLPVLLAQQLLGTSGAQVVAGLAALAGHNWSVFLRFEGGRGVATGIGGLYAMAPWEAALVTVVTVAVMLRSRYISLGSVMGGVLIIPVMALAAFLGYERPDYLWYVVPGALVVVFQHRDNIERLRKGTERKLGEPAVSRS